ncbi:MAG: hypothetical protein JSV00_09415 [bacterium]|nr:MAG: hypothetical protein JSV00_09415 [bacterium]
MGVFRILTIAVVLALPSPSWGNLDGGPDWVPRLETTWTSTSGDSFQRVGSFPDREGTGERLADSGYCLLTDTGNRRSGGGAHPVMARVFNETTFPRGAVWRRWEKFDTCPPPPGGGGVSRQPAPDDMVSMMSFLWAELFGGVDIVAEVRTFARDLRHRRRPAREDSAGRRDPRSAWKLRLTYRMDDDLEVVARLDGKGDFMRLGRFGFEVNAADMLLEKVGMSAVYRDGGWRFDFDDVETRETLAASISLKF